MVHSSYDYQFVPLDEEMVNLMAFQIVDHQRNQTVMQNVVIQMMDLNYLVFQMMEHSANQMDHLHLARCIVVYLFIKKNKLWKIKQLVEFEAVFLKDISHEYTIKSRFNGRYVLYRKY